MKARFKRVIALLKGFIPQRQPIGRTELETFTKDLLELYNIPQLVSYKNAVATMILQDSKLYRSKWYYMVAIRKAQANETAYQIMQELRKQEKAEITAATGTDNATVQN